MSRVFATLPSVQVEDKVHRYISELRLTETSESHSQHKVLSFNVAVFVHPNTAFCTIQIHPLSPSTSTNLPTKKSEIIR
ncbi:hypothetical protein GJ744_002557 [Endocarpon pusillum]|uniref:Uncharacterized protein n=1 Tax=Endocarpon pusillum TaxID=364733 RepID=A0A8H7E0D6_9EURO|nr:hypothetical protein GJ744_002557 [Endocarpon pusillum]